MSVIDSKKLLPPSKQSSAIEKQKFLVPIKSISAKKISASALKPLDKEQSNSSGSLVVVRKKIIKLKDLVNNSLLLDRKDTSNKRKEEERNKADQREKKLEEKVKRNDVKTNLIPSIPGQSLFDKINRFIGFTLLGYLFNKYGELLPKLLEFGKVIEPAAKFVEGFAKNLLKGVVDFIEFGYKTYDKVHDTIKNLGGEGAAKTFEDFSNNLNLVLNGAIAAAMIALSTTPKKPGDAKVAIGGGGAGNRSTLSRTTNLSSYLNRDPQSKLIERRYGNDAARMYEARRSQGASISRARADVIKRFEKFQGPQRGLAGGTGRGGIFSRGFGKSFNRASLKVLGKGGTKLAKGALGRVPIVGGLLNFAFALAMGEKPGRAAAKAVGSTAGAALGTFIPVPFAGTILGGILGDIVGGALYDTLVDSGQQKPQGRAQGGAITRGGQSSVSPSRQLKTRQRKVAPRIQPQKTEPGKNIGGKVKIEDLYGKDEPGKRSALRALKKSSEDVKRMRSLNGLSGAMFGAGIDMALGQKPDRKLATSIGNMFGSVVQNAIDSELNSSFNDITKTFAMANGGVVPSREIGKGLNIGEKIGKFISNALAVSIDSSVNRVFQNLNKELNLEGGGGLGGPTGPTGPGGGPDVFHGRGAERMWNFFKNKGLSDIAVAGILGNARWESSFSPTARGKGMGPGGSDAIGLFQWGENDRWKNLVNWARSQNLNPWDFDTQLKFAWYEMQNSEKSTIPALQSAVSASDAAEKFRSVYERSRHTEQRRKDAAEGYYQQFKGKMYIPPTPSAPNGGGSSPPQSVTGNLKDTGLRDSSGRPIRLKGVIADAFIDMASAARRAGINLGSGISSSYRSLDDQIRVYQQKYGSNWRRYMVWNSRHMSGEAFDINWNSAAGIWIRNNARRFGFGYNTYSGESTHFDWVGGYTPNRSSAPRPPSQPTPPPSRQRTAMLGGRSWSQHPVTKIWTDQFGNRLSNGEFQNRLIQEKRNQQASLAPTQSSTVASLNKSGLLNTDTSVFIIENNSIALQMIEVPTSVV